MSLTRIKKPNQPLALDSGASSEYRAAATWIANNRRTQSNKIWVAEFKNELSKALVSARTLVQQDQPSSQHLADQFTTYPRYTTHVHRERSTTCPTHITTADNSTYTVDISNLYLQVPVRSEQQHRPPTVTKEQEEATMLIGAEMRMHIAGL